MTTLPPLVMGILLFMVWGTTAIRLIWARDGVIDARQNTFLVLASITVLLAKSWVREPLDEVFGFGTSRHVGNAIIMVAFASLLALAVAWTLGPDKWPRIHVLAMAGFAVPAVGLLLLSGPARAAGQRIETYGGWQYAAYFVVYAVPATAVGLAIIGVAAKGLRATVERRDRRVFAVLIGLALIGALDNATMAAAAVMTACGVNNAFTEFRTEVNGITTMFILVGMCAIAARPALRRAAATFRLDAASRRMRRLAPMWRTLTAAVPEVVLDLRPADRRALPSRMALHRMCVEIRDAILLVEEHSASEQVPADVENDDLRVAVGLHLSCMVRARGGEPTGVSDTIASSSVDLRGEVRELLRLADQWNRAEKIARDVVDYDVPVPN